MPIRIFVSFILLPCLLFSENLTLKNQQALSQAFKKASFEMLFRRERGKTVIAPLPLSEFTYAHRLITFQNKILEGMTRQAKAIVTEAETSTFSPLLKQKIYDQTKALYLLGEMKGLTTFSALHAFLEKKRRDLAAFKRQVGYLKHAHKWGFREKDLVSLIRLSEEDRFLENLSRSYKPVCRVSSKSSSQKDLRSYTLRFQNSLVLVYGTEEEISSVKHEIESRKDDFREQDVLFEWLAQHHLRYEVLSGQRTEQAEAFFGTLMAGFMAEVIPPLFGLSRSDLLKRLQCLGWRGKSVTYPRLLALVHQPISQCQAYFTGTRRQDVSYVAPCP